MQNPLLWGAVAIAIGLGGAGIALYTLKPLDRPLTVPGSVAASDAAGGDATDLTAPPTMITIGSPDRHRMIHLVLGDDRAANKQAFDMAVAILPNAPDLTLNIVPAITTQTPLYKAFTWVMALQGDPAQQGFLESLMGTTGAITTSVLSVIAQNNAQDPKILQSRADSNETKQAMEQARDVLPPALPAIQINGTWLAGDTLNDSVVREALGQAQIGANASTTLLSVSHAYAFATPPKPTVAAMFMTLRNVGKIPVSVIGASSPAAGRIEIHGHVIDDQGVMQMRAQPSLDVKPSETVTLKPLGLHLMPFDLPAPLVVGQRVPLTLQLQGGSEISTLVTVTKPGEVLTDAPRSE